MQTTTFRGRILTPEYNGYRARLQLELALRAGIGSVLCKPQWWRKWRGLLPAKRSAGEDIMTKSVAEKWLDEITIAVLRNRFYWMTRQWQYWASDGTDDYRRMVLQTLVGYPIDGGDDALRAFQQSERTAIAYQLWGPVMLAPPHMNCNSESTLRHCSRLSDLDQDYFETLDSFAVLCWYFAVLAFSHRVKRRLHNWGVWATDDNIDMRDTSVHERVISLIQSARNGDINEATFTALYTDADARPKAVELIWFHVQRGCERIDEIHRCVQATLDGFIDRNDLMNPASANGFISPGPVIETWMSDSIVPEDVKAKFVREVAVLEDVPEHEKDWHPGSNQQVLDLVHPSLYCCALGETRQLERENDVEIDDGLSAVDRMYCTLFSLSSFVPSEAHDPSAFSSDYQWIPSDFRVDGDGNVKILSYINNLHPVHFSCMYESIEHIFSSFVPLFDRVLSSLAQPSEPAPEFDDASTPYDQDYSAALAGLGRSLSLDCLPPTRYSMKGTTVQVITKIAEIHLTPDKPVYPGGSWHIEGTDTENIVATGIYYFGCENITESKLSFRVIVTPPEYEQNDHWGLATKYGLENDQPLVQSLGAATAVDGRCIVFPNTLQHKVEPFQLEDPSKPGVRKILAFFLVNPSKKIPSTSVIPPQQEDWLVEADRDELRAIYGVSDSSGDDTVLDSLGAGMSSEDARYHRKRLMEERGPFDLEGDAELIFSLCEH
ncbi:hypothetical protein PINS_up005825 [Pythium insidiosum]|nr:hypothetical protein PINS_up005825 [Pythium insidiosum]